jgi:hypothetical protein
VAGGAFQIRSKRWDIGVLIGSLVLLIVGFGGLFLLQQIDSAGNPTLFFIVFLGLATFCFFAGPGIVYVLRKRNAWVKKKLPGGTMPWIRSHLYLPILALVAAFVHATVEPFRLHLSSGKVLLVVGILVSIAGVARHHLIGVQKAALNVNVAISKLSTGQPRDFRRLVADFTDTGRPVGEIDAEMAQFSPDLQERWAKIKTLRAEVDKHFPRTGGQTLSVRSYKVWRALHPPLTILLFAVLAFHVWDVLGGNTKFFHDQKDQFVSASSCAGCHSREYQEWAASAMTHAQTSTITVAQLPVTLAENRKLADDALRDNNGFLPANNPDSDNVKQEDLFNATAKVCTTCHAQVGARFAPNNDALLPFDAQDSAGVKAKGVAVSGGGSAVQSDGVGCSTCHGTSKPPSEMQAAVGNLNDEKASGGGFGAVFAPLFEDPNPLPQRIHDIGNGDGNFWNDPIQSSQLCGACHDVKVDLQGDGLAVDPNADPTDPNAADTSFDGDDLKGTPITDLDTAQNHDSNGDLTLDENKTDPKHDVVLQTTYDEWQDYVAFFNAPATADAPGGFKDRYSTDALGDEFGNPNDSPLGCSDCHMPVPSKNNPTAGVVDHAPGILPIPQRDYHEHTFVGVDYDLNPAVYAAAGASSADIQSALADSEALERSAVTLKVTPNGDLFSPTQAGLATQPDENGDPQPGKLVTFTVQVRNNLLAHTFPTGFAFARQFWLQVAATTKDGTPICLSSPFVAGDGSLPVATPCTSGVLGVDTSTTPSDAVKKADAGPAAGDVDTDLRSCDANDVGNALGLDVATMKANLAETPPKAPTDPATGLTLQNLDVRLARTFPNDNCDPWLTNFQKILTDGDPQQTGTKTEVAYQSFVPNLVQIRGRIATGQAVTDLQPVRLAPDPTDPTKQVSQDTGLYDYTFFVPDNLGISNPDDINVQAKMEFRHLPPYFVSDLAQTQQDILDQGFNVPEEARIFDDSAHPNRLENLLDHEAITEVGAASSSDGQETLACDKGAQNVKGGTILDCVNNHKPAHTVEGPGFAKDGGNALPPGHPPTVQSAGLASNSGMLAAWSTVMLALLVPFAWWRRRRRRFA